MLSPASNMPYDWNYEAVETLKRLWNDGASASEIAAKLPGTITRSAVIGKVHRLKLSRRTGGTETKAMLTKGLAARRAANGIGQADAIRHHLSLRRQDLFSVQAPPEEEPGHDVTGLIGLLDLERHSCRWPMAGQGAATLFCGRHSEFGPYCSEHATLAGAGYGRGARP